MAKKNSAFPMFAIVGVFFAVLIVGGAYSLGAQSKSDSAVLASSTTSSTNSTKAAQVASQAYSKCVDNGGFVTTERRGNWGYYQVCNFADDMNCELYALYDGQCPVGGVHTIGYSTRGQVFCALRGGQPTGRNNGQCKMPDGVVSTTDQVYTDTCSSK